MEKFLKRTEGFEGIEIGKWIEFNDYNGYGFAQPDVFLVGPFSTIVFEIKLKETAFGHQQIEHLYRPLLWFLFRKPVIGILTCKFIQFTPKYLIEHPGEILDETEERTYIWHWLG